MKNQELQHALEVARDHLGAIDLVTRLLFLAAATPGFSLEGHAIGHLAIILYNFKKRHAEILAERRPNHET